MYCNSIFAGCGDDGEPILHERGQRQAAGVEGPGVLVLRQLGGRHVQSNRFGGLLCTDGPVALLAVFIDDEEKADAASRENATSWKKRNAEAAAVPGQRTIVAGEAVKQGEVNSRSPRIKRSFCAAKTAGSKTPKSAEPGASRERT